MAMHFEELWTKCEELHPEDEAVASILDELAMKVNLYKALDAKKEIGEQERETIKSRTMGEILLTLTKLSKKDNINVYEALSIAMQYRSIESYSKKYETQTTLT
jgi:hypothetical protein